MKLYIYPLLDRKTGTLTTVENLQVAPELRKLYEYLVEKGCIEQLDNYNAAYLPIFSRDVIEQIKLRQSSLVRASAHRSRRSHPPPRILRLPQAGAELRHAQALRRQFNRGRSTTVSDGSGVTVQE